MNMRRNQPSQFRALKKPTTMGLGMPAFPPVDAADQALYELIPPTIDFDDEFASLIENVYNGVPVSDVTDSSNDEDED